MYMDIVKNYFWGVLIIIILVILQLSTAITAKVQSFPYNKM